MPVHEALLAEIYQVQSAIGQMTGYPETELSCVETMRFRPHQLVQWRSLCYRHLAVACEERFWHSQVVGGS